MNNMLQLKPNTIESKEKIPWFCHKIKIRNFIKMSTIMIVNCEGMIAAV
jgi:hypothetical protein